MIIKSIRSIMPLSLIAAICSCSSFSESSQAELLVGSWDINTINENVILPKSKVSLNFTKDNKISGKASCNNINSSYRIESGSLTISPTAATRMMCPSPLMEQESQFLQALNNVTGYQITSNTLSLTDEQGNIQFTATKVEEN